MKKKHMNKRQYKRYKKTHRSAPPLDGEQGKIKRETLDYVKYRRKSDDKMKRILQDVIKGNACDMLADEDDFFDEYDFKAGKEIGNARQHNKRIKGLERYEN
jgi:hypothetical protein